MNTKERDLDALFHSADVETEACDVACDVACDGMDLMHRSWGLESTLAHYITP